MLKNNSHYITYKLLKVEYGSHHAYAVYFFIYDMIRMFLLLSVIIFSVSVMRSFFPPERTKRILLYKKEFIGNILAALSGLVINGKLKHAGRPLPTLNEVKELIKAEA